MTNSKPIPSSSALLPGLAALCMLMIFLMRLVSFGNLYGNQFLGAVIQTGALWPFILLFFAVLAFSGTALARIQPSLAPYRRAMDISAFTLSGIEIVLSIMNLFMMLTHGFGPRLSSLIDLVLVIAAPVLLSRARSGGQHGARTVDGHVAVDEGFSLTADADRKALCFAIKGAGIGFGAWFGMLLGGVVLGGLLAAMMSPFSDGGAEAFFARWFLMFMIAFGWAFLWALLRKRQYYFEITDVDVLAPDGQRYARNHISEILLRNKGTDIYSSSPQQSSGVVVAGTGLRGAALVAGAAAQQIGASIGHAIGQSISGSVSKRNNEVCIRHGRKVIPLARYLREDDAISLYNKVTEVL